MKEVHIVTGATGRTGYPLCLELKSLGHTVRALYRSESVVTAKLKEAGCEVLYGDVTNIESIDKAFSGGTYVYHLAGVISIESKASAAVDAVNIVGTQNVIDMCIKHNIKRLIHTGSVHALTIPKDKKAVIAEPARYSPETLNGAYAKSKAAACNLVLDAAANGLDAVIVLPSGIIGPYEYVNTNFGKMIEDVATKKLRISLKGKYDFVDVRDVAFALASVAVKGEKGQSYIASGNVIKVKDMLNVVTKAAGVKKIRFTVPLFLVKMAAKSAERKALRRGIKPVFTPYSIRVLQENCNFSYAKLNAISGYVPRDINVSLNEQVEFLKERQN